MELLPALQTYGPWGIAVAALSGVAGFLFKELLKSWEARVTDEKEIRKAFTDNAVTRSEMTTAFNEMAAGVRLIIRAQEIRDELDRRSKV